ncbi:hypothetical protein OC845_005071 [Tilletia horrida]|nr:hypothetical protein OC845_005071 [Tilletia horrida]
MVSLADWFDPFSAGQGGRSGPDRLHLNKRVKLTGSWSIEPSFQIMLQEANISSTKFLEEVTDQLAKVIENQASAAPVGRASSVDLRKNIHFITHRVVHGANLVQPLVIAHDSNADAHLRKLEDLETLAPLHNVVSTMVIKSCLRLLPKATNLCLFDTSFHATIPEEIRTYPVWQPKAAELPGGLELRKWGFHGLSYSSVLRQVSAFLERPASALNIIVAHLGSGASICAIRAGKSLDTTMGLTPLEGLPGSTRSGSVDPALSQHLKPDTARHGGKANESGIATAAAAVSHEGVDLSELGRVTVPTSSGEGAVKIPWAEWELNSKSGWLAVAGTRDFAEIVARKEGKVECSDEERRAAKLAFDIFVDRIISYLGAYSLKLAAYGAGHLDAIVFSGGIGEHSTELRLALAAKLEHTALALRSADGGHYGSDKVGGVCRILGPAMRFSSEEGSGSSTRPGHITPGSPLAHSTPGSPRLQSAPFAGRWGVPWLVCETDEEVECVRLAMPTIRASWASRKTSEEEEAI